MTKRTRGKIGFAFIALLLIAGAWGFLNKQDHNAKANPAAAQDAGQPMPVKVEIAERKPLRIWTSYSGRLVAVDYVELRPEVSGRIDQIKFEDGQIVNKGDVLMVIDPRPYNAAAQQAQAALSSAKNQHDLTIKELKRAEGLLKSSAVSQKLHDERQNAVSVSQNAIESAQAQLAQAKLDLDHAYVKAPISGRISRPEITVGNLVQAGPAAPVLTSIVSDKGIYADFEVDEQAYLRNIHHQAVDIAAESKMPVKLTMDGEGAIAYEGYIKSFDNKINASSGTIRARAYFDNENGQLIPGMYARISMGSPSEEDAILLTDAAISTDQDRKFVYVVGEDGKVAYRAVELGTAVEGQHVILSGLEQGEKVIVEGIMKIRPDMMVAPQVVEKAALETAKETSPEAAPPANILEEPQEEQKAEEPAASEPESQTPSEAH